MAPFTVCDTHPTPPRPPDATTPTKPTDGTGRWSRRRRRLAVAAAALTLPYSALKVAWLAGARVGLSDPSFGTDATMHVLNGATLAMDLVACALAVVFFTGARAPRWFVLPTMWVGYGLLGQILVVIGPSVAMRVLDPPTAPADASSAPIDGWVYLTVYAGFSGLGLCLLPAFAIYAWERWGIRNGWGAELFGVRRTMPTAPVVVTLAVALALLVRAGDSGSALEALNWAVDALIGLLAVAATCCAAAGRPRRLRRALPLLVCWTASGAWVAWGCYHLVLEAVPNDLAAGTVPVTDTMLAAAKVAAGAGLLATLRPLSRP